MALLIVFLFIAMSHGCAETKSMGDSAPIGDATMEADGTIVLNLRAEGPDGKIVGHSQLRYPPDHKEYKKVLEHLGGLKPGENKLVPPWP